MKLSLQIDALEKAQEHAETALAEWQKYKLLCDIPEADARNEALSSFIRQCKDAKDAAEKKLNSLRFRFSTTFPLRATFFNPDRRRETEDRYIISPPDRDIDEPHIGVESWTCMRRYLMGDNCMVDEDFDVYVITSKKPHRVVHVIPSCRKNKSAGSVIV